MEGKSEVLLLLPPVLAMRQVCVKIVMLVVVVLEGGRILFRVGMRVGEGQRSSIQPTAFPTGAARIQQQRQQLTAVSAAQRGGETVAIYFMLQLQLLLLGGRDDVPVLLLRLPWNLGCI